MSPAERGEFLAEQCGTDDELRDEVKSFLTLDSNEKYFNSFTEENATFSIDHETLLPEDFFLNKQIGKYKVLEKIGEGGMGIVYLAERTDGEFEQKVAIKFLRQIYIRQSFLRRFFLERQILAKLHHRFIAQLIDGGTTDEGTPYLVMEYVEGIPITEFVEKNNLPLRERLLLFIRVCEAVSFAHKNSVIHRDLKPDNILITSEGKPKLLDFGIAKLLSESDVKATVTRQQPFTPEFASPEQMAGQSITTVSDVYVLGIVLYEILTNTHPFLFKTGKNGIESDPSKNFREITSPSVAISKSSPATGNLKRLKILSSQLKGDLDNIVLKALHREPERRYQTAGSFVEDIERYLDGLPVQARPATFSYRTKKFVNRNKIPVVAGLLIFLILMAGTTFSIWQAREARNQANLAALATKKAEDEILRAKKEEEKAKKIAKFMEKIIAYANPGEYAVGAKYGGQTKVIEALNEMGDKIDVEFSNEPDVQSELHHKFAEVYVITRTKQTTPGMFQKFHKKAEYHAQRAIKLRKDFYGEKHELVAKDMFYLWVLLLDSDTNPERVKLLAEAIVMMRETNRLNLNLPHMLTAYANRLWSPANDTPDKTKEIYYRQAIPKPTVSNIQLAEDYYREAIGIFKEILPKDHLSTIHSGCGLSKILIDQKKFKEAQKYFPNCRRLNNSLPASSKDIARRARYEKLLKKGLQTSKNKK